MSQLDLDGAVEAPAGMETSAEFVEGTLTQAPVAVVRPLSAVRSQE